MSADDDNLLSRWSRRKLAARQAALEAKAAQGEKHPQPAEPVQPAEAEPFGAEPLSAPPVEAETAGGGPVEARAHEPLPRLEDLGADSDLSAFLRKGVPAALKNSALRKMWSLDPAIRDFVGPAEYAWDFNTPGSMPGFGPLEAGSQVVDFLSTAAARFVPTGSEIDSEAATPAAEARQVGPDEASPCEAQAGSGAEEPTSEHLEPTEPAPSLEDARHAEAADPEKPATAESPPAPARSRHGGALPR